MKHFKSPSGFSLLELLIAMVILAISLLALAGLMVFTTQSNASGSHLTEASTFAQDIFERLRARSWNSMVGNADAQVGSTGQTYQRAWAVSKNVDNSLAEVIVTMTWSDPTNHQIVFSTEFKDPAVTE